MNSSDDNKNEAERHEAGSEAKSPADSAGSDEETAAEDKKNTEAPVAPNESE
jgi:hypothetical protein